MPHLTRMVVTFSFVSLDMSEIHAAALAALEILDRP